MSTATRNPSFVVSAVINPSPFSLLITADHRPKTSLLLLNERQSALEEQAASSTSTLDPL